MPRRPLTWLAAVAITAAAWPADAQDVRGVGGAAATRSVSQYAALERELEQALVRSDQETLDRLLDADLQVRVIPHDLLTRDAWLAGMRRRQPARIHDVNVQEAKDVAVASFLLDVPLGSARVRAVVDLWRDGKLISRTESAAAAAQPAQGPNPRE